ncbi:MAG: hypothetical protein U9M92_00780 [Patescibacteria group bacterium]|nr:hypothetical protein [Patescibacteria group bacterium]
MTSLTTILFPLLAQVWDVAIRWAPLWAPIVVIYLAIVMWFRYIRARFLRDKPWVLLEIKLPKQIDKTPQAMELAMGVFYQTRDHGNLLIDGWVKGETRTWFSLEIASFSGDIHFYVRTDKFFKNLIESQLYAQYPGIEIFEVDDYVDNISFGLPGSDWDLWATDYKLAKEDVLPIKTYIDYGMDKIVEEENKVDPMTAMIEYLGTVGANQQVWIQILAMAAKDRYKKEGKVFSKEGWTAQGKRKVDELMKRDKKGGDDEKANFGELMLSPGERKGVENAERNLGKLGFDCGIRGMYLYRRDVFTPLNIVGLLGAFKQYASAGSNGFKAAFKTAFNYPWQDPFGWRLARRKRIFFDAYRRRSWFYPPYQRTPFVLSAEELATIFHFPGQVAGTPTLPKIESKRAVPPENLPV